MDLVLFELCILEDLLYRLQRLLEKVHVQFLEFGAGERLRKVLAFVEALDFEPGGHLTRKSALTKFPS